MNGKSYCILGQSLNESVSENIEYNGLKIRGYMECIVFVVNYHWVSTGLIRLVA